MSEKVTNIDFDKYIQIYDVYFVQPNDAAKDRFDLYELKEAKNQTKHPDGKMDDIAFGLTLERAIELVCHTVAQKDQHELEGYLERLRELNKEIREQLIDYCK